jgi:hypothetical protein
MSVWSMRGYKLAIFILLVTATGRGCVKEFKDLFMFSRCPYFTHVFGGFGGCELYTGAYDIHFSKDHPSSIGITLRPQFTEFTIVNPSVREFMVFPGREFTDPHVVWFERYGKIRYYPARRSRIEPPTWKDRIPPFPSFFERFCGYDLPMTKTPLLPLLKLEIIILPLTPPDVDIKDEKKCRKKYGLCLAFATDRKEGGAMRGHNKQPPKSKA